MNRYHAKTSGLAYTLSALLPLIFQFVVILMVQLLLKSFGSDNYEAVAKNKYFLWMLLFLNSLAFLVIIYKITKRNKINFALETGLRKRPDFEYLGLGLAAAVAMLFFFEPIVTYFVKGLEAVGYQPNRSAVPAVDSWGSFFMSVFLLAILPAVFEEGLFRGVLLSGLKGYGKPFAVLVSAALFTLMHQNVEQTIYQFAFGVALGYAALASGSLIVPMSMHFASNFIVIVKEFVLTLAGGQPGLVAAWQWVAMAVGGAALAAILLYEFAYKARRRRAAAAPAAELPSPQYPRRVFFAYAWVGIAFNLLIFFLTAFHVGGMGLS